jgi:hypothetical protein
LAVAVAALEEVVVAVGSEVAVEAVASVEVQAAVVVVVVVDLETVPSLKDLHNKVSEVQFFTFTGSLSPLLLTHTSTHPLSSLSRLAVLQCALSSRRVPCILVYVGRGSRVDWLWGSVGCDVMNVHGVPVTGAHPNCVWVGG